MFRTLKTVDPQTATEQAAYDQWLDQTVRPRAGPHDRVHGAVGVIPTPLWVVLFFIAVVIFVYMLFFADSGERAVVQALLMGSVVVVDHRDAPAAAVPRQSLPAPASAGCEPVAMERTLRLIDQAAGVVGQWTSRCRATRAGSPQ